MNWRDLLTLLKDMERSDHTSLDKPVEIIFNGGFYEVDVIESLTKGDAYLTADIRTEEAGDDN